MDRLEQTRQAWEDQAEAYDRALTATDMQAAEVGLRMAGVGPDTRVLDIACGGGAVSIPAARMGAEVLAVDFSSAMVELLAGKAREMGLANLSVRRMDGMALELEDESFDAACSSLGVMLFPDRAKGLGEMARVVRPGGRGVMIVLGPPRRVQPIWIFLEAMMKAIPAFEPPRNSPLFCLQDLDVLKAEMEEAGFGDVRVTEFETAMEVESGHHLWESLLGGAPALAGLMRTVSEEQQRTVRASLVEAVDALSGGAGRVPLPMTFNIGVGTK